MGEDKVASHAKVKFGHSSFQNRPVGVKTGQHPCFNEIEVARHKILAKAPLVI